MAKDGTQYKGLICANVLISQTKRHTQIVKYFKGHFDPTGQLVSLPAANKKCGRFTHAALSVLLTTLFFSSTLLAAENDNQKPLRLWVANTATETGLIPELIKDYNKEYPDARIELNIAGAIAVLEQGQQGNADLIITHYPAGEELFVKQGYGESSTKIMYNEFVILGPRKAQPKPPITIKDPLDLLRWIAREQLPFITPGKRSGTYRKLDELWTLSGIDPDWVGYEISGVSAAAALQNAATFETYAFADLGTYLVNREQVGQILVPFFRDHITLRNDYSAIVVSDRLFPGTNKALAQSFLDYLVSDAGQQKIAAFGRQKYGTQIYTPAAHLDEGLKTARAQQQLAQKIFMLKILGGLLLLLAITIIVVTWLFNRVRSLEQKRRLSEERFQLAVNGSNDGIWDWNIDTGAVYFSPRLNNMLGITNKHQAISNPLDIWKQRLHPKDRDATLEKIDKYLQDNQRKLFMSEHRIKRADGNYIWVLLRAKAIRNNEGKAIRMSGSISDIDHRKQQEAKIKYQALHDTLTGLPNRTLLMDSLQRAVNSASRRQGSLAFIIMDLDRFKEINDTLGHQVGDEVLQKAADRLQRILRKTDIVVRLGGDEFAVLLPVGDQIYAKHVAEKILLAFNKVFELDRHDLYIGCSMGIALFPEHGRNIQTLIRHADVAMYAAKRANSGYAMYDIEEDPHSLRRLALEKDLREAIDNDSLELYYQPKVNLGTKTIVGVEALIRWNHPTKDWIPPDELIPIAEQTGLIKPLLTWVLEKSFSQLTHWRKNNLNLTLSVNISVWNLQDPLLVDTLRTKLCEWNIPPSSVELEITESAMMADPERAMKVLDVLNKMGVRLAVDDFGTGFSSLAYLKRLPVNTLKIDKSFVMSMTGDNDDATIVRSTIDLAHNLKLDVVAEGVEDKAVIEQLTTLGCETAQGHYISHPLSADSLTKWMHESDWGLDNASRTLDKYHPTGSYKTH